MVNANLQMMRRFQVQLADISHKIFGKNVGGLVSLGTTHQALQQYIYMSGSLMIVGDYSK